MDNSLDNLFYKEEIDIGNKLHLLKMLERDTQI
jgi:hypothetical protein